MAEELLVVLNRNESTGFGFSLLGKPGLPPVIYNIVEDSPAAESGEVEVGDVILKVNETDVNRFSTKEVLKCLRLSSDPVTLKIKRDPKIKASLRKHLLSSGGDSDLENRNSRSRPVPGVHQKTTNGSCGTEREPLFNENERLLWEPLGGSASAATTTTTDQTATTQQPKFEAYMMTGEHILNISKMQPQQNVLGNFIIPKQQKKADSLRYHNSHAHHLRHQSQLPPSPHSNSLPASPNESDLGFKTAPSNSARSSPVPSHTPSPSDQSMNNKMDPMVRTSRSEDQLQDDKADLDDVTSSLNTLLDTREVNSDNSDRIVWTYNAPSSQTNSSSTSSPLRGNSNSSASPSPTSVSSSVMSSQSSSSRRGVATAASVTNGDCCSEQLSNISSPDYRDDENSLMQTMGDGMMECSDASDSDSTLLVSEPKSTKKCRDNGAGGDHRIVIQVKGPDAKDRGRSKVAAVGYQVTHEYGDGIYDYDSEQPMRDVEKSDKAPSPQSSEDESDVESLHSFHYSPKAVDLPSAIRLAKRLYCLDGFKKSDVSRHLSKNNDFSRAVAEEYLKYFDFKSDTLDTALRKFLKQFSLTGETQERERVLVHFSKRYLDCNPGAFNSQDAVHTLTCAIMLLNTDLHGQNINRKMACNEFVINLAGLNEGENFPTEVLKQLYHAIKKHPLEWALDEEVEDAGGQMVLKPVDPMTMGGNPFLDIPTPANAIEYKKGYVMRKCCFEANAKKSLCCYFLAPFHKRSWKMFYCTLRDLVLYLHKDENGFRKNQMSDNFNNAIRIHHALATKATDYTKKLFVFRLQTADQAEYLFQTSDSKELQSWIDTINFVCASFSAQPLEAAVGSQKKFQRPLLPCSHTKLNLRDQLRDHEERVHRLETELEEHHRCPPERNAKSLIVQNYKEKETYLNFELKRYRTYTYILRSKMCQYPGEIASLAESSIGEVDEASGVTLTDQTPMLIPPPIPNRPSPTTNRRRCPE